MSAEFITPELMREGANALQETLIAFTGNLDFESIKQWWTNTYTCFTLGSIMAAAGIGLTGYAYFKESQAEVHDTDVPETPTIEG